MPKTKKTALWTCVIVLACMLSYCIVSKVQQYNYIHSNTEPARCLCRKTRRDLRGARAHLGKQRNGGVTLYRAAYYPRRKR